MKQLWIKYNKTLYSTIMRDVSLTNINVGIYFYKSPKSSAKEVLTLDLDWPSTVMCS